MASKKKIIKAYTDYYSWYNNGNEDKHEKAVIIKEFEEFSIEEILEIIHERCLGCGEGTEHAVEHCEFPECQLYNYRNKKTYATKNRKNN